jgi:N-methylhydantoinase A
MGTAKYLVGVDVGGTFTDIFVLDRLAGTVSTCKVPSSPDNPANGFIAGIDAAVADAATISSIVHGTTVGTNALLERKGARTGIITTEGFRDVLEMRRRDRPTTWGLWGTFEPVVPRDLRLEVPERTLADGTVRRPVDPADVQAAAQKLREAGCDAVCLFFINGYANDDNERVAVEALRAVWPNDHVTAATEILPEIREFERCSTATINAYLQPVVSAYLDHLTEGLGNAGFGGDLSIVQSNGGIMAVASAKQLPVRTTLSGPAAGVIAANEIASAAGLPNIITCDMGGTSFDVSLIAEGKSTLAAQLSIDFGLVVRTPMIEITTIGAGGGSIAWVDGGGILQVGPQSAGSDPGPVCYGLGNTHPTVTDANLVLGRINADRPIGGRFDSLDIEAARQAIERDIALPLDLEPTQAAEAILRVANAKMAAAIRLVSIERGHDPRKFVAMPFGGGGALHTGALIKEVGLKGAIVPRFPGVTSALGCVVADVRHDRVQTVNTLLDNVDATALGAELRACADELATTVTASDASFERLVQTFELDMLYAGQTHTVQVPLELPAGDLDTGTIRAAFEAAYLATYGRLLNAVAVRIMNYRVAVVGQRPAFDFACFAPPAGSDANSKPSTHRRAWADGAWCDVPVYERLALPDAATIAGPALLEQPDATTFIEPGLEARIDGHGNLIIMRGGDDNHA